MALFVRVTRPPGLNNSRAYRRYLQTDFEARCAYCERPEEYMGGEECFEVEHFRPTSKFPELNSVYTNLYYACRGCNGHKSETWPSEEQATRGMRFADPCASDPYALDLQEEPDGGVSGITPSGAYTKAHIRLNRESVRKWRQLRAQARNDLPIFGALVASLEGLHNITSGREGDELASQITALKRYIEDAKHRFRI